MTSVVIRHGNTILRYRRPVQPLVFPYSEPWDEKLGETKRHLRMRTLLHAILARALAPANSVGSEQFVYFNASDPRRSCSPDAFVKLGVPDTEFPIWKTWEHGAPELVVEIISPSDREPYSWDEKLVRFHELGAREVVRFDPDAREGARIRAWDRIEDDLVERAIENDRTPCLTLGLHFIVGSAEDLPIALRLARDEAGNEWLYTPAEAERLGREAESVARQDEARARAAAEARVRELEAELAKRS